MCDMHVLERRLNFEGTIGSSWIPGWRPSDRDEVSGDRLREDLSPTTVLLMSSLNLVNLASLIDDAKCNELVRRHRSPEGLRCAHCDSASVARHGHDDTKRHRQRYRCKRCHSRFDDLTGTVLAGHHQPLRVWVLRPYFMGLNLSNRQIAQELDLNESDGRAVAFRPCGQNTSREAGGHGRDR
jgi:transposase-like protein